jgi:hypothetical protein
MSALEQRRDRRRGQLRDETRHTRPTRRDPRRGLRPADRARRPAHLGPGRRRSYPGWHHARHDRDRDPAAVDESFWPLAAATHSNTAAHPTSSWVFPGSAPGRHISASSLRERLQRIFSPQAARLGTLDELIKLAPIAIIADALGYTTQTIERHARGAATTYAEYFATRQ